MGTVEELEARIDRFERALARSGLTMDAGRWFPGSLQVVRVDADGDGDFDPYTSTDWDGDSHSDSNGTISWTTDFGVPTGAKMVYLEVLARDSGSAGTDCYVAFKAKSTTTVYPLMLRLSGIANDEIHHDHAWLAVAEDGTSYYSINATGSSTMDVWIRVVAYAR